MPAPAMADRVGARRAGRLKDHAAPSLHVALGAGLNREAVLRSDGDPAFAAFARTSGTAHYAIPAKGGARIVHGAFHIQTVNQVHPAPKAFLRPFDGPATGCLSGYLAWFVARRRQQDPWGRMLAARPTPNADIAQQF